MSQQWRLRRNHFLRIGQVQVHVLWAGGQVLEVTVSLKPETGTRITGTPPFGARNEFCTVWNSAR
jgi:hypothetical protein